MNQPTAILAMPSPEKLAELEAHVQSQLNGRLGRFRLTIRDNGLVLKGFTETYYAKQLAQQAVMEASPIPIRANEIEVARYLAREATPVHAARLQPSSRT